MTRGRPALGVRRGPGDEGTAAVEFALVVPLLVALLYLVVFAGSIYVDQLHLQTAARNGARIGSVVPASACPTALDELATNEVGNATCALTKNCADRVIQLSLTSVQQVSIPLIGDRTVTLRASSSFACNP